MVDLLALAGVVTISISHPYSFGCYKVMVSNVNLIKDSNFNDSDVLMYVLVKYYIFRGSAILL